MWAMVWVVFFDAHQVPFSRSSLNHNDVFILDTASKIFLFSGCNSSIQERAKALEVVQFIKENKHNGKCEVATIGWNLFFFYFLCCEKLIWQMSIIPCCRGWKICWWSWCWGILGLIWWLCSYSSRHTSFPSKTTWYSKCKTILVSFTLGFRYTSVLVSSYSCSWILLCFHIIVHRTN